MRSWVSVPVLSVQSTSMAPKFWIELRRLTITFFRDIETAPMASVPVTIIGSISGVRPTAMASAKKNASFQSFLVIPLRTNTITVITAMKRSRSRLTPRMPCSKLVSVRRLSRLSAIVPR